MKQPDLATLLILVATQPNSSIERVVNEKETKEAMYSPLNVNSQVVKTFSIARRSAKTVMIDHHFDRLNIPPHISKTWTAHDIKNYQIDVLEKKSM